MGNSKKYNIFAGINGAGKSTLYYSICIEDLGVRLNSDEFVVQSGKSWKDTSAQAQAGRKLLDMQEYCFKNGLSMNRETTLSGINIINSINKAKNLGYEINLFYVGVSSLSTAKQRVYDRVKKGGHGVSDEIMAKRYLLQNTNLLKVLPLCDKIQMFDNSNHSLELVAFKDKDQLIIVKKEIKWLENIIEELNKPITFE